MTPRWVLPVAASSAVSVISLIVAIVALARDPTCPRCEVAAPPPARARATAPAPPPPAEPTPAPAAPIPPPPTPSERSAKLVRMRHLVDELGIAVVYLASTYPKSLPAKVTAKTSISWEWAPGFTDAERMAKLIPWLREKIANGPPIPEIDGPAVAFLDHVDAWLSPWEARQRYFARGDFLDDGLAEARRTDPDLRGSVERAISLFVALSTAVDSEWHDEIRAITNRAPDSDRAAFERAYTACGEAFVLATFGDLDKVALGPPATACRDRTDELRARRIQEHEMSFIVGDFDAIAAATAELRRTGRVDRGSFHYHYIHAAQLTVQLRDDLSEAQAEAPAATIPP